MTEHVAPPRRTDVFWLGLLLAVAALLGGGAFAVGTYLYDTDPHTVVRDYYTALARGDAAAALGYGEVPAGGRSLLTAEVLAAQNQIAPMSDIAVLGLDVNGDTAQAHVRYTLGFPTGPDIQDDQVPMVRTAAGWRLAHSAVPATIGVGKGSDRATIAGAAIPVGELGVFPGATPIVFDTPSLVLDRSVRTIRFGAGGSTVSVDADISKAGRDAVLAAFTKGMNDCLGGTSASQARCPIRSYEASVPGSLRGKAPADLAGTVEVAVEGNIGQIYVHGRVAFEDGKYAELDPNNVPVSTPVDALMVGAHFMPTDPNTVIWDQ